MSAEYKNGTPGSSASPANSAKPMPAMDSQNIHQHSNNLQQRPDLSNGSVSSNSQNTTPQSQGTGIGGPVTNLTDEADAMALPVFTEAEAHKKLTTRNVYLLRKLGSTLGKKVTWAHARIEAVQEIIAQEDIERRVRELSTDGRSVLDKMAALAPNQQATVNDYLNSVIQKEFDHNFEWSLEQINRTELVTESGFWETVLITLYFKRGIRGNVNPVALLEAIERHRINVMRLQALRQLQPPPGTTPPYPRPVRAPPAPGTPPFGAPPPPGTTSLHPRPVRAPPASPDRKPPLPNQIQVILSRTGTPYDSLVWNWSQTSKPFYDETPQNVSFVEYWLRGDKIDVQPAIFKKPLWTIERGRQAGLGINSHITHWLQESKPSDDKDILGGLRLIFQEQGDPRKIPFPEELLQNINKHFNLPAVDTHDSSKISGTHGKFIMRDDHPCECMTPFRSKVANGA